MNTADLLSFIVALLIGILTAYLAKGRGRNPAIWFFVGTAFGIFGLIGLFLFPIVRADTPVSTQTKVQTETATEAPLLKNQQWFYLDAVHAQHGPIPFSTLESLWNEHTIGPSTYLWYEGMNQWKKIEEDVSLQGLFSLSH